MTKKELKDYIASVKGGLSKKEVEKIVDFTLDSLINAILQENTIEIRGFGTFRVNRAPNGSLYIKFKPHDKKQESV